MDRGKLYHDLFEAYKKTMNDRSAPLSRELSVVASYICPPASDIISGLAKVSQMWRTAHVRESQYCLHVVHYNDLECCSPWRSSLQDLLPGRFLPNPVPLEHNGQGIIISNADHVHNFLPL